MNTKFAEEHELLKQNLKKLTTFNKIGMLIMLATMVGTIFRIIDFVITYESGADLYEFGTNYILLFICAGLYFILLKGIDIGHAEYKEEEKGLFKKYLMI